MSEQIFICYYVLAGVSISCTLWVTISLLRFGSFKALTTKFLFYIHLSILSEEITIIPKVYNGSNGLCQFIEFLHFYSGLAHILSVSFLVVFYRNLFYPQYAIISNFHKKYSWLAVTMFPLITALPFTTNAYENPNNSWCTLSTHGKVSNTWAFSVFYVWVWALLIKCVGILLFTAYQVYSTDREMMGKLFSSFGAYCIISLISWIPRTVERLMHFGYEEDAGFHHLMIAYTPIYLCGIFYFFIFLYEQHSLKEFEEHVGDQMSDDNDFTWEYHEENFDAERSSSNNEGIEKKSISGNGRNTIISMVDAPSDRLTNNSNKNDINTNLGSFSVDNPMIEIKENSEIV